VQYSLPWQIPNAKAVLLLLRWRQSKTSRAVEVNEKITMKKIAPAEPCSKGNTSGWSLHITCGGKLQRRPKREKKWGRER